jgi:phosphate-selective porin OprO/OprP
MSGHSREQEGTIVAKTTYSVAIAVGVLGLAATTQAHAQVAGGGDAEIAALKKQLATLEQKLDKLQKQTDTNSTVAASANKKAEDAKVKLSAVSANSIYPAKGPIMPSGVVVKMPNNRPTICTADDQNCIAITSRLQFDAGGYNFRPNSAATSPQHLDNGVNARRARIGIIGKFAGDWNYALIYDFGGASDGFGGTGAAGSTSVGFLPGGATSGLENAYLSYTGFHPLGGKLAIEGGYMDLPYTLEEATSSNDILFMERGSAGVIATNIAAGDFRSTFGARWYTDTFWAGAYATGPASGAIHSASSVSPQGTSEQDGAVVRVAGQVLSGPGYSFHLGADAQFLIQAPHNFVTGAQTLTLSDRPELRIDPTVLITTAALTGVSGAQVYSVETAGNYGPLFFQGEYFWYNVDRSDLPGLSSVKFDGGYGEVAYAITGENRPYNPASASYGGLTPLHPFSLTGGGLGAIELAGRVSIVDLNDQLATANGVAGGRQTVYTAGLNWYPNSNIRFMFNYLHGDISKQISALNSGNSGSSFDAFAMRTQIAF